MNRIVSFSLLAAIFACFCIVPAFGQGGTGELTGLVTDPTGAVVSNAEVTLTNAATGEKRTATTTGAGIYRFIALPVVGAYTLESAPKGFKRIQIANVVVSVGTVTSHDIQLELGSGTETVSVEAGAQLIQTEDSSVSQLIDHRAWESMPIQSRSQNELINMVAGAEPEMFNNTGRGASVNGTRSGTGNYLVEGADNNEQGQGGVALFGPGGANTTISPDAIQEYRVLTHDFSAEYGKAGGFVTDTVLKSGTNKWHGSAFEYNRNQEITGNDWFSSNAGVQDHLVRNQFGGSLGGPVIKDKTFFYGTGEIQRLRQGLPVTVTSMTQQFLDFVNNGSFETFQESDPHGVCVAVLFGTPCPGALSMSNTLGPIFQQLRTLEPNAFPAAQAANVSCDPTLPASSNDPNCVGQGIYTGGLVYPVPVYGSVTKSESTSTDQARFSIKFDHKLTDRDQLNFSYLFDDVQGQDSGLNANTPIGVPEVVPSRAQTASLGWTRNLSSNMLNQFRIGYLRRVANFTSPDDAQHIPAVFTFDAMTAGFGPGAGLPQFFTENQYQMKDDLSLTKGRHNWKFGFEYRRTQNASKFFNDLNGTVAPWSAEDLVTDLTFTDQLDAAYFGYPYFGSCALCSASIDATGTPATNPNFGKLPIYQRNYRANEFGVYGQDDWRVTSRLTLNLGIRWDYFGPPHNADPNLDSNFYFGPATTPIVTTSINPFFPTNTPYFARVATGSFQTKQPIWNQDRNNFAPRVGFAWDTRGNQKVVIRGGFGIMYDRIYNNLFENIRFNPPYFADVSFGIASAGSPTPAGALATPGFYTVPFVANQNGYFTNTPFKANPRHMDQNLVSPYYEQTHFGLEYQLAKNMVLETDYVGTFGRKLIGILNDNTFDGRGAGGDRTRPNPNIGSDNFRTNAFGSNYHALQVQLRKSYAMGLQFNANYTYGKTLDELSDAFRAKGTAALNGCQVSDCQNPRLDYGPADFDVKHRAVFSYTYDLPLAKGNKLLGGWQLNGIFQWQSGVPINITDTNDDLNADGLFGADRGAYVSGFNASNATTSQSPGVQFLKPVGVAFQTYTCPSSVNGGAWCNSPMPRNNVYGPHFVNLDFGFGKSFLLTESVKLSFFANFFDVFNHPNFDTPVGNVADSANFGKSIATLGDEGGHRVGQLALRIDF